MMPHGFRWLPCFFAGIGCSVDAPADVGVPVLDDGGTPDVQDARAPEAASPDARSLPETGVAETGIAGDATPADAAPADPGDEWYVRPASTAATPPMGWNSWNAFHCAIDEASIKAIADAVVSRGLKAAGYAFVNVDDCWQASARDVQGNIQADPAAFPDGMQGLVGYVHGLGLKAGIYTTVGAQTCAGRPGSLGYTQQDANTYASWAVDYAKIDWCGVQGDPPASWTAWRDAILATGWPMTYSVCTAGRFDPGSWADAVGNLWRTTDDINTNWDWILQIADANEPLASLAGPGHWNDPDMLEVGNGLTDAQNKTHFSLWAIMAAPLIAGNDLRTMPAGVASILTNTEVIAVDQDPIGYQGVRVVQNGPLEVWAKPLHGAGSRAVALLNRGTTSGAITVDWTSIGLAAGPAKVRDLWARADLGTFQDRFTATVAPLATTLVKVDGTPPALPHGAAYVSDLGWTYAANYWGPAERDRSNGEAAAGDGHPISIHGATFTKGVGTHAGSLIRVRLGQRCTSFSASVGVDDEVTAGGTVTFQVWADGDALADTGVMKLGDPARKLVLDVTGKNELRLLVGNARDGNLGDHADWADAKVGCAP
jgi:alpha-galactosidase